MGTKISKTTSIVSEKISSGRRYNRFMCSRKTSFIHPEIALLVFFAQLHTQPFLSSCILSCHRRNCLWLASNRISQGCLPLLRQASLDAHPMLIRFELHELFEGRFSAVILAVGVGVRNDEFRVHLVDRPDFLSQWEKHSRLVKRAGLSALFTIPVQLSLLLRLDVMQLEVVECFFRGPQLAHVYCDSAIFDFLARTQRFLALEVRVKLSPEDLVAE